MARIRCIFDKADVVWQTGQLGRVDQGGGGTVAMYLANRNIDTCLLYTSAPFARGSRGRSRSPDRQRSFWHKVRR